MGLREGAGGGHEPRPAEALRGREDAGRPPRRAVRRRRRRAPHAPRRGHEEGLRVLRQAARGARRRGLRGVGVPGGAEPHGHGHGQRRHDEGPQGAVRPGGRHREGRRVRCRLRHLEAAPGRRPPAAEGLSDQQVPRRRVHTREGHRRDPREDWAGVLRRDPV